ncbi:MAG: DUF1540 domain-containing protein [Thermoleophilia bacterium]|nr:DUF1540 domain-containing protein [Thermoleophilia bacterium]
MQQPRGGGLVLSCLVEQCSWWKNRECHAPRIQVGSEHPTCDTYTTESQVSQATESEPPVSNCSVQACKFNEQGEQCMAPGITVGHHADHADCDTYVPMAM